MTERKHWRATRAVAMAAAALALSGCAATHVGEDWQCPLAQGEVCTSVAAADPAVPETGGADRLATGTPLYESGPVPRSAGTEVGGEPGPACEADCGPFAWLGRLIADITGDAGDGDGEAAVSQPDDIGIAAATDPARGAPSPHVAEAPDEAGPVSTVSRNASAPDAASLPAPAVPSGEDLRAPEVIGRVWIAPFVDADGIYREGSYVRLVIEPARWRLR